MASHHTVVTIRPRTLANILLDLKEARRDWEQALSEAENAISRQAEDDAGDRMSEADTRIDDLRDEFSTRFLDVTGLTWKQIETAQSEMLL